MPGLRRLLGVVVAATLLAVGCGGGAGDGSFGGNLQIAGGNGIGTGGGGSDGTGVAGVGSGGTGVSGDGGIGSGGTGIGTADSGSGSVDGIGSIIVGGTRFDTDSARLLLQDVDALKLGITVRVAGSVSPDLTTGVATVVFSAADLRGTARQVDPGRGTFQVLTVPVTVDSATVFAGGLARLNDLRNGDPVMVHGLPGPGTSLRATRVERLAQPAALVLSGPVEAVDALGNATFRIGSQWVRHSGATLTGGPLAEGMRVRVRAPVESTLLEATSVELVNPPQPAEGSKATLSGMVLRANGLADLQVDGALVDASNAQVSGGPASRVGLGARIDVSGTWRSGILVASRVKIREAATAADFSLRGNVSNWESAARFIVKGQVVDASGPQVQFVGGTSAQLGNGRRVLVSGSRVADDVLVADRVEYLD